MNSAKRDFSRYVDNVLKPVVNGTADKAALAIFLNRQLDEWELEAEHADGVVFAPLAINAIEQALATIA
jgi:hypothetical protein